MPIVARLCLCYAYSSVRLLLSMIIYKAVVVDSENGLHAPNSNSVLQAKHAENICERTSIRCCQVFN